MQSPNPSTVFSCTLNQDQIGSLRTTLQDQGRVRRSPSRQSAQATIERWPERAPWPERTRTGNVETGSVAPDPSLTLPAILARKSRYGFVRRRVGHYSAMLVAVMQAASNFGGIPRVRRSRLGCTRLSPRALPRAPLGRVRPLNTESLGSIFLRLFDFVCLLIFASVSRCAFCSATDMPGTQNARADD